MVVLLILGLFSIVSWVIIFQKALLLTRCKGVTERFRAVFRKATDWRELKASSADFNMSPLVGLFTAGYSEVTYQLRPAPGLQNAKPQIKKARSRKALNADNLEALGAARLAAQSQSRRAPFVGHSVGLRATVPGPSLLLASSGPIEGLLAAARAPGPSPIPQELSALASRELLLWAPEPFGGIAAAQ